MTAPVDLDDYTALIEMMIDYARHFDRPVFVPDAAAAMQVLIAELRAARQDAARWQWWQQYMTVGREEPGEWTCWIEIPCIPTRSQSTSAAEITDAFLERFPLVAAIAKGGPT